MTFRDHVEKLITKQLADIFDSNLNSEDEINIKILLPMGE
jgi:hypothetical protein